MEILWSRTGSTNNYDDTMYYVSFVVQWVYPLGVLAVIFGGIPFGCFLSYRRKGGVCGSSSAFT